VTCATDRRSRQRSTTSGPTCVPSRRAGVLRRS
jgi:hypothetical protein